MKSNSPSDLCFDPDIYESQFTHVAQFTDIPFWIHVSKEYGPRVLELACGAGRITIPVAESGVDIEGVDYSEGFLTLARERAQARSLSVRFHLGDIRSLPFHNEFDLMYLPACTISHLISRPEAEAFLAGVRNGLRRNGVLALDVHNPTNTWLKSWPLKSDPEFSSFVLRSTKQTIQLRTTYEYHTDTQVFAVNYLYTFPDGTTKASSIVIKLYFPVEIQMFLDYNGFQIQKVYGDYTQKDFDAESKKYVVVARKRD
jgi:ubiquinone/menaquinone biosynthesis C-methylase UbiE